MTLIWNSCSTSILWIVFGYSISIRLTNRELFLGRIIWKEVIKVSLWILALDSHETQNVTVGLTLVTDSQSLLCDRETGLRKQHTPYILEEEMNLNYLCSLFLISLCQKALHTVSVQ